MSLVGSNLGGFSIIGEGFCVCGMIALSIALLVDAVLSVELSVVVCGRISGPE